MTDISYIVWNMNGNYYDAIMVTVPDWVCSNQDYEDFIALFCGA